MIVFGGYGATGLLNDTWALTLSGTMEWKQLAVDGDSPPKRFHHSAVLDRIGHRMIVFGGAEGGSSYSAQFNDAWALSLTGNPSWSRLAPLTDPPLPRDGHLAIFDSRRNAMLVFGGYGGRDTYFNDVWELSLADSSRWRQVQVGSSAPPAMAWFPGVYDEASRRIVLIYPYPPVVPWALSLDSFEWNQVSAAGVPPEYGSGNAVVDASRRRLILYQFGGRGVWSLSLGPSPAWSELQHNRAYVGDHSAVYDSTRQRMVVFGGATSGGSGGGVVSNDTWTYALRGTPGWTRLETGGTAPAGEGQAAVLDSRRDRLLVFGLCPPSRTWDPPPCANEVWSLSLSGAPTWSRLTPAGEPPEPSRSKVAIYDPIRDRMIVVNGESPASLRALALESEGTWTGIASIGDTPGPLWYGIGAFYDRTGDRMIVLDQRTGKLWGVSLDSDHAEWTALGLRGRLPGSIAAAGLDDSRRELIAIQANWLGDSDASVWSYSFDTGWSLRNPTGGAAAWRYSPLIYDPLFDRLVLAAGVIPCGDPAGCSNAMFSDVWTLSRGSPVEEVSIDVEPGSARNTIRLGSCEHVAVAILGSASFGVDSIMTSSVTLADASVEDSGDARARILDVNHDGYMDLVVHFATRAMGFGPGDQPVILRGATRGGTRIIGFDRARVVLGDGGRDDTVALDPAEDLHLRVQEPASSESGLVVEYSLTDRTPARLELFDVMGRRVATRELIGSGPGTRSAWIAEARSLPPGVYVIRLTQGGRSLAARAVVLR